MGKVKRALKKAAPYAAAAALGGGYGVYKRAKRTGDLRRLKRKGRAMLRRAVGGRR